MNLTGFQLDSPTDAAIDRLFIEPLIAAASIDHGVQALIDIGSGGGSPGIPMALALCPGRTVLVEARAKKATFLKEATRALGLSHRIDVLTARFEDLAATSEMSEAFDLLTVRAVRVDSDEMLTLTTFLGPGGQLILFGTEQLFRGAPGIGHGKLVSLPGSEPSFAEILQKA